MSYNRYYGLTEYHHSATPETSEPKVGVLLVNLGTPSAPTAKALRPYLRQFLSDPRVVEVHPLLWKVILNCFILPFRPKRSARLYQNVWHQDGSPLLLNTRAQALALGEALTREGTSNVLVDFAMCYGKPSVREVLRNFALHGVRKLLVIPLYPQYSATTTGSVFDAISDELKTWRWLPELRFVNMFHDHPLYIVALAHSVREVWDNERGVGENRQEAYVSGTQKLVISFHGIPERYFRNGDPYYCYCQKTGRLLAEKLGLGKGQYHITFQSRFGREPWLQPYTDETLQSLARQGIKSVDVICPGFFSDCLETLDEIARESCHVFRAAGGETFRYIPCLNARPEAISLLASLVREHLPPISHELTS